MNIPKNLMYTKSHEWVELLENGEAKIGLTDFAQESLGNIVFVNLPETGDEVTKGSTFADVESVKAVSDVYSPVNGKVLAINESLLDSPEKINESPYEAWLVKLKNVGSTDDLLTSEQYEKVCTEGA